LGKDISCLKYRACDIISSDIVGIHEMSRSKREQSISCRQVFDRKAFKIDVRYIDGICNINDKICILSVFQSDICQFNIGQDLPNVEKFTSN